jgi:hypothetical protein
MTGSATIATPRSRKWYSLRATSSRKCLPQKVLSVGNPRTAKTPGPLLRPEFIAWRYGFSATGSGFPKSLPPPVVRYEKNPRRPLRDFEGMGTLLIVSAKALSLLKMHAADSIDYRSAEIFICDKTSEQAVDGHSMCDVVRFEDLLDFATSDVETGSNPNICLEAGGTLAFLPTASDDIHLFRVLQMPDSIFCSRELARAIMQAGLTGVQFFEPGGDRAVSRP